MAKRMNKQQKEAFALGCRVGASKATRRSSSYRRRRSIYYR